MRIRRHRDARRQVQDATRGDQCVGSRYAIHDDANPQFCDSLVVIRVKTREIKYSDNLSDPLGKRNMAAPRISRRRSRQRRAFLAQKPR